MTRADVLTDPGHDYSMVSDQWSAKGGDGGQGFLGTP